MAASPILADFAAQAAGPGYVVASLIPAGANPHAVEPAPSHARMAAGAAMLVANGLGFDTWAARVAEAADFAGVKVAAAEPLQGLIHPAGGGPPDPHAWQDPALAAGYVGVIAAALARMAPREADGFRVRARLFSARMRALRDALTAMLAPVRADGRPLVVAHQSLAYFARAFGLRILAASPGGAHAAPSAAAIAALIREVRAAGGLAVFPDAAEDPRLARQIAREAGLRLAGPLHVETAPPVPVSPGADGPYIAMMRANAQTIRAAFG